MKLTWIGQAGYRLRANNGTVILIDPYMSDSLLRDKGESYTRLVPIDEGLLSAHVDVIVFTHLHQDHTDFDTLDRILAENGPVALLGPVNVLAELRRRYAMPENYMLFDRGIEITINGILFRSTFAAHSDLSPIGVTVEGDGRVLCHTGDTMFHRSLPQELPHGADALMLPINGSGYNMNAVDAARLTRLLEPKRVLPMHWDMFSAYGCDVKDFTRLFTDEEKTEVFIPEHYREYDI